MKFLVDRIALRGTEYRVLGDTDSPMTEVWGNDVAWEFDNREAAYRYIASGYRTANDLRSLKPGQQVQLPMASGESQIVNVVNNDQNAVTVVDTQTGQQMMIPHMQTGAQPKVMQGPNKSQTPTPADSDDEGSGGDASMITPGTGTVYALSKKQSWRGEWRPPGHPERKDDKQLSKKQAFGYCRHTCNRCGGDVSHYLKDCTEGPILYPEDDNQHPDCIPNQRMNRRQWERSGATKEAGDFPHRHPYHCKHDGTYLQNKNPSDAEKECPSCGMVYAAERKTAGCDSDYWVEGDDCSCPAHSKEAATFSPFDKPPVFPEGKPKVEYRPYRCMNCGNEQMIQTNHLGQVIDYCKNCSWKPSFGNPDYAVPFNGRTYRPFEYAGPTERTVIQRDMTAESPGMVGPSRDQDGLALAAVDPGIVKKHPKVGPMTAKPWPKTTMELERQKNKEHYRSTQYPYAEKGKKVDRHASLSKKGQPAPSGPAGAPAGDPSSPPISSNPTGPQQAPAGDQPQPQAGGGQGRPLSRHEIITEAEILIRNALFKGIRIGTWDLVQYMKQQYGNPPEELYEGATKAWEKVQWEEQEAFEQAKGPGPQQPKQPGQEAEELPMSPQDVAQQPQNGPSQVHV